MQTCCLGEVINLISGKVFYILSWALFILSQWHSLLFLKKNISISRWYLLFVCVNVCVFVYVCYLLKIPLTSVLFGKLTLLFICLFISCVCDVCCITNLVVYWLLETSISQKFDGQVQEKQNHNRARCLCAEMFWKDCVLFFILFSSNNLDTNIIEPWHNMFEIFLEIYLHLWIFLATICL